MPRLEPTAEAVVAAARELLYAPYLATAAEKSGCDCIGCVIYTGIAVGAFPEGFRLGSYVPPFTEMFERLMPEYFDLYPIEDLRAGDVLVMNSVVSAVRQKKGHRPEPSHCYVVTNYRRGNVLGIIGIDETRSYVTEQRLEEPYWARIWRGAWRFKILSAGIAA